MCATPSTTCFLTFALVRFFACALAMSEFVLPLDRTTRSLAGARVGLGVLAANRQSPAVTQAPVTAEIHEPLDVHGDFASQVAFDLVPGNRLAQLLGVFLGKLRNLARSEEHTSELQSR